MELEVEPRRFVVLGKILLKSGRECRELPARFREVGVRREARDDGEDAPAAAKLVVATAPGNPRG